MSFATPLLISVSILRKSYNPTSSPIGALERSICQDTLVDIWYVSVSCVDLNVSVQTGFLSSIRSDIMKERIDATASLDDQARGTAWFRIG